MRRRLLSLPFIFLLVCCVFNSNLIGQVANDNCEDAIEITLGDGVTSDVFTNVDATTDGDGDLPEDCFFEADEYQNTVYFSFVGDGESYTITTSNACLADGEDANDDTQLVLLDACGGTILDCNEDIDPQAGDFLSTLTVDTEDGAEYILLVDGYDGTDGGFCFSIESADTTVPECTLDASFFEGVQDEFTPVEVPTASGFIDWNGVNPDPATVLIAFGALADAGNEPYNIVASAGTIYTGTVPPFALSNLQLNSGDLGLLALTQDDLDNAGETITITLQSEGNADCSAELSFAVADFVPNFEAYPPGEGNTSGDPLNDGVCDPVSSIESIELAQESLCSDGSDAPVMVAPESSLPDVEFVVETNGAIQVINAEGSVEGVELIAEEFVCYTAFAYDLGAINTLLNTAADLCPQIDCDAAFGLEGINDGIAEIVAGDNPGSQEPGLENLQEALDFASFFGTEIVSVATAAEVLNTLNENIGGLLGNICYATSATVCIEIATCEPTGDCEAVAATLVPGDDPCETGLITATVETESVVPEGYIEAYVLTTGEDLSLVAINVLPEFDLETFEEFLDEDGLVTIHSLVLDTLTFPDTPVATGGDVYALTIDGGGDVCASLDVAGAVLDVSCEMDTTGTGGGGGIAVNDSICDPETMIAAMEMFEQESVCADGSNAPTIEAPEASLPQIEYAIEVNGIVQVINFDGSLAEVTLTEGDELCYTAITYDSLAINALLDAAFDLCITNGLPCDDLLGEGTVQLIIDLVEGNNDGEPGLNDLTEAIGLVSVVDPDVTVTDVQSATDALDLLNENIGGLLGNVCYGTTAPVCISVISCEPVGCEAQAATLIPLEDPCETGVIAAEVVNPAVVPEGYIEIYVLTTGEDLLLTEDIGFDPVFDIGDYEGIVTIHSFVFDTLNTPDIDPETGGEIYEQTIEGGGEFCMSLDPVGASFDIDCGGEECEAQAGSLEPIADDPCLTGFISAEVVEEAIVPEGYIEVFVLTIGEDLNLVDINIEPSFELDPEYVGLATIHNFVLDTLTLSEINVATGGEVFALTIEGGGDICASLDVAGAAFDLVGCEAGEGVDDGVCDPTTTIDPMGPIGQATVCTDASDAPVLEAPESSLPQVEFAVEVNGIVQVINFDGSLAEVTLTEGDELCYTAITYDSLAINALLDAAFDLCITNGLPCDDLLGEGTVQLIIDLVEGNNDGEPGLNDLTEAIGLVSVVDPDVTVTDVQSATDALDLLNENIGGLLGNVCYGTTAPVCITVIECTVEPICEAEAGTLEAIDEDPCDNGGIISAEVVDEAIVPEGYIQLYVLTEGEDLDIIDAGVEPSFEIDTDVEGLYTIHSFVVDTLTFPFDDVSTGGEAFAVTEAGGGDVCASLDVAGAAFEIDGAGCFGSLEVSGVDLAESPDGTYNVTFEITDGSGDYTVTVTGTDAEPEEDNGTVNINEVDCEDDIEVTVIDNATGEEATLTVDSPCEPVEEFSCEDYPIEISLDYSCNENSGIYTLTYSISGGLPQYAFENGFTDPNDLFYSVTGDINEEFYEYSPDNNFVLQFTDVEPYSLSVEDNGGCSADISGTPASCIKTAIELLEFEGKPIEAGNDLSWKTASEQKSSHFILERSYNEVDFDAIAQLNAAGESYTTTEYQILDDGVTAKTAYYRLISVDQEGFQTISNVITVVRPDDFVFGIGPFGPVPGKDKVIFSISLIDVQNYEIHIFNLNGKEIGGGDRPVVDGEFELNISQYPAGVYFLRVTDGKNTDMVKFIKQ